MKEQSHKSEMRAALRGDFERLRARRGGVSDVATQVPQPTPEPEPAEPSPAPTHEAAEPGGASWLARMRDRL